MLLEGPHMMNRSEERGQKKSDLKGPHEKYMRIKYSGLTSAL